MRFSFHVSGGSGNGSPRWQRLLSYVVVLAICTILLVRTVPSQRLFVLPIFGFGIVIAGVNLYKELRQIYKERAKEDDIAADIDSGRESRFCPYCGTALHNDFEFCNACGKKLPK